MKILKATEQQLDQLVPLFNGYRIFYKQPDNSEKAKAFLKERFRQNDSVIFMAFSLDDEAIGFTQLYPIFSSVRGKRAYILNDLFVSEKSRGMGTGEALLKQAVAYAKQENCIGLSLETEIDNPAQHLYEKMGWVKDEHKFHYSLKV
ncbi:GNAT family N-acetyltransferase [uncultured Marixanthomonas sp.]|uniref:GNAT family N-acetyltransferase n=1 Tax=uncultured Marixanthomonas sp. TaxID=757245 RepID=UPI0030DA3B69|tara:strand:+ start:2381 stop:2821 length:441 start_codon:yes stop_codon:yes gene_type:complete